MTTRAIFTGKVDHRYAWIGNDAEGSVDFFSELAAMLSAATTSIALSTMTFNYGVGPSAPPADAKVEAIAALLAQKAAAGLDVRIVGNGAHRWQAGYFRAQRGGAHVADNNLSALLHRISFQSSTAAPPGFIVDRGEVFGPRGGGLSYGWAQDMTAAVGVKGSPDATFTSPLLRECYGLPNSQGPRTWSIELPAGHYYVLVATGEAAYNSKSFVLAQGQTIFLRRSGGVYQYFEHTDTGAGEFSCSSVDGGTDSSGSSPTGLPMARRLEVTAASGRLELTIGKEGQPSWSSVCYIEIYRASSVHPFGDPGLDPTLVQERSLHHTKFILTDAATTSAKLWTGSHNMTPVDPAAADVRSEDAIVTSEPAICAAFRSELDQWWGGSSGPPNAALARSGIFKGPSTASGTMPGVLPGTTASWSVYFSPSSQSPGGFSMYQTVADHLGPASAGTGDVLLLMEQLTDGGTYQGPNGSFPSSTALVSLLKTKVSAGTSLRATIGDTSPTESIFTSFAGVANATVQPWGRIHDKVALVDALHDNPTRARGKVLCGSMNWSQSALHVNDEQSLFIGDPALANQFLQRAAMAFDEAGIELSRAADCVVVLDRSYSMNDPVAGGATKIAAARVAAKLFLDMLAADGTHRVALVRFGATVEPFVPPSTLASLTAATKPTLSAAIDGTTATLPIGSSTCYGLALQAAFGLLTSTTSVARKMVVFLTDGKENTAPMAGTTYPAMASAGIEIHTTSFGVFGADASGPNAILAQMALASGGSFGQVDDDTVHLQKRFAAVARDAMGMITILDPTWVLGADESLSQPFPVDMRRGTLVIVLLWGTQNGVPRDVTLIPPWGGKLTARTAGVSRTLGEGYEVYRISLDRIAKPRRDVRGTWSISATAPKGRTEGWRVDLCVFASDTGPGRLVAELTPRGGTAELLVRAFAGAKIAEAKVKAMHVRAPLLRGGKRKAPKPSTIRLGRPRASGRELVGVTGAELDLAEPGVHEVRLVVEGTAEVEADPAQGRSATISVPFRRERALTWFVPESS